MPATARKCSQCGADCICDAPKSSCHVSFPPNTRDRAPGQKSLACLAYLTGSSRGGSASAHASFQGRQSLAQFGGNVHLLREGIDFLVQVLRQGINLFIQAPDFRLQGFDFAAYLRKPGSKLAAQFTDFRLRGRRIEVRSNKVRNLRRNFLL